VTDRRRRRRPDPVTVLPPGGWRVRYANGRDVPVLGWCVDGDGWARPRPLLLGANVAVPTDLPPNLGVIYHSTESEGDASGPPPPPG
jgi:hypothetical protein